MRSCPDRAALAGFGTLQRLPPVGKHDWRSVERLAAERHALVPGGSMAAVFTRDIIKKFGEVPAVNGISLTVPDGEFMVCLLYTSDAADE